MNIRKHTVLIASGVVTIALAGALLYFLFRFAGQYRTVSGRLDALKGRLKELNDRVPYPEEKNVELAARNLTNLQAYAGQLMQDLLREQYEPPTLEPAQFPLLLQGTIRGMNQVADANKVLIPDRFAYGFERYARGLPVKDDLPRLARQIHFVDQSCRMLFSSQVRDLISVERHVFEEEAARAAADGSVPMELLRRGAEVPSSGAGSPDAASGFQVGPGELFIRERMYFTFNAKEKSIWDFLNALPRSKQIFCRVAEIAFVNEFPKPQRVLFQTGTILGATPGAALPPGMSEVMSPPTYAAIEAATPPPVIMPTLPGMEGTPGGSQYQLPSVMMIGTNAVLKIPPREERVVAGRHEVVKVRIGLDFYHFKRPAPPEAAAKEAQP